MSCYVCGMSETKLCDGILSERFINPQFGSCDRPMCDRHAETVGTTYLCHRGKGKPTVITRDLCAVCLAVYQSKKS
jgi:hypothetical protein